MSPEGDKPNQELSLYDVLTPDHLRMVSQAAGNFTFADDRGFLARTGRIGYTDMRTRTIRIDPVALVNMDPHAREGFLYHEAGHHAPEVIALQNLLLNNLENREIIPEAYRGSPRAETRFLQALHGHLHNGMADIWLESFMSRDRYNYIIGDRIRALYEGVGERDNLKGLSKPEQLVQLMVGEARWGSSQPLQQLVDEDVYASFEKIQKSGAWKVLQDNRSFHPFASPAQRSTAIARKYTAYEQVYLPEYLKLLENELEKRKQQKQQEKQGQKQGQGQKGQPQPGGAGAQGGAPLTKEEEESLIDQILKELEEAGKDYASQAPAQEEEKSVEDKLKKIKEILEERAKQKEAGKDEDKASKPKPKGKSGEENLREASEQLAQEEEENRRRGLAKGHQVRQETVDQWVDIKREYKQVIESTANDLAEIFVDDRRKKLDFNRREGDLIPGLEFEEIAALRSGEADPKNKMRIIRNLELLETELEGLIDVSGSMGGEKLRQSIILLVTLVESFKKVRETLEGDNLLVDSSEQPFRVGATKFDVKPERVTTLEEPLSDKKELTIIDKLSILGGGTEETEALKQVYKGLTLRQGNVIKIMLVLSDGYGNKEGVAPIIQQVEEDNEVIFIAVGLGDQAKGVVETYVNPLRDKNKNVIGIEAQDPKTALPAVLTHLKREVGKRRSW